MITIEGVDITGLVIEDDFVSQVVGVTQTANDGSLIVYEQAIKFKELNLIGGADWGWLNKDTLTQLRDMSNVIGAVYEFDYEGELSVVRFRSEDIPVVYGKSLIKRSNTQDTDYYNDIVIKLTQV